jgi:hypothetical protein
MDRVWQGNRVEKCELRKRMFEPESKTDRIFFVLHVYVFP